MKKIILILTIILTSCGKTAVVIEKQGYIICHHCSSSHITDTVYIYKVKNTIDRNVHKHISEIKLDIGEQVLTNY